MKRQGLEAEFYATPFNQYQQELIAEKSGLSDFEPEIVLFLFGGETILHDKDGFLSLIQRCAQNFPASNVLLHNAVCFAPDVLAYMECNSVDSNRNDLLRTNLALASEFENTPNIQVVDLLGLFQNHGAETILDPRMNYLAKQPFSAKGLEVVARQLADNIRILLGARKKCLVLDLDNTLWGGVVGEVGPQHVALGDDGEGKAFYDFQAAISRIADSGVILAVCSKNDESIALEAMRTHPFMLLRPERFAAFRINWENKSSNLASMAEELNLGLDSFVFLDDSPHERDLIRQTLPQVTVPEMPVDPAYYVQSLASWPYFETFSVTVADSERSKSYVHERKRREMKATHENLDDYLHSLNIVLEVREAGEFDFTRVSQLTQRTNQFNLTTRRYTVPQIQQLAENDQSFVLVANASDRFGDSGTIGVAIFHLDGGCARLDSLLASCRVLGRGIEQAFMCSILESVKKSGVDTLYAEYIPTDRNGLAASFLESNGFSKIDGQWMIKTDQVASVPAHVELNMN